VRGEQCANYSRTHHDSLHRILEGRKRILSGHMLSGCNGSEHNPNRVEYTNLNAVVNQIFDGFRGVDDETTVSIAVKITINKKQ
jgi:hypothetical protein